MVYSSGSPGVIGRGSVGPLAVAGANDAVGQIACVAVRVESTSFP